MIRKTHRYALECALSLLFANSKDNELKEEIIRNKKMLFRGALNEDFFCVGKRLLKIRMLGLSHFYNPETKSGFLLNIFSNGKDTGVKRFNKAKKYYIKGDIKNAYYNLGRAVHLLHDLAAPAHAQLLPHYILDRCEIYINKNCDRMKLPRIRIVRFKRADDYYHSIAAKVYHFEAEKRLSMAWQVKRLIGLKKRIPKENLREQAEYIFPMAVSYTAGLIEHFFKDARK